MKKVISIVVPVASIALLIIGFLWWGYHKTMAVLTPAL